MQKTLSNLDGDDAVNAVKTELIHNTTIDDLNADIGEDLSVTPAHQPSEDEQKLQLETSKGNIPTGQD